MRLENQESTPFDYHMGKSPTKVYVSKRFESTFAKKIDGEILVEKRALRFASKVIESDCGFEFIKEKDQIVLRITPNERQEIVAKFFEDGRGINILQIQKFTRGTGSPHKICFSFVGAEIETLFNFVKSIPNLHLPNEQGVKISDDDLRKLILTKEQAYSLFIENEEIFKEIVDQNISGEDVKNLVYKRSQLRHFENLLTNSEYFDLEKVRNQLQRDEDVWQNFFEKNTWIFGFGLQYIINVPLENQKLEQVVAGYDVINKGKRTDAFLKTRSIVSSLCFAEIKTHSKKLLNAKYRPGVYPPSNELSGGIAQLHKTVQGSLENLSTKIEPIDRYGDPTGEQIFVYKPRSFLLIGSLEEFISETGVNKEKYSSFELYRKSIKDIEILTFDELLERAKYIVETSS